LIVTVCKRINISYLVINEHNGGKNLPGMWDND